jgi:hypothetical protein
MIVGHFGRLDRFGPPSGEPPEGAAKMSRRP